MAILGHIGGHKPAYWLAVFLSIFSLQSNQFCLDEVRMTQGTKRGSPMNTLSGDEEGRFPQMRKPPSASQVQPWGWGKAWAVELGYSPLPLGCWTSSSYVLRCSFIQSSTKWAHYDYLLHKVAQRIKRMYRCSAQCRAQHPHLINASYYHNTINICYY